MFVSGDPIADHFLVGENQLIFHYASNKSYSETASAFLSARSLQIYKSAKKTGTLVYLSRSKIAGCRHDALTRFFLSFILQRSNKLKTGQI
jgi:hypothetical protein